MVRLTLFVVFSFNLKDPGVILLVILVASQLLMAIAWYSGGVYKSWPMNILEALFLINLGVLTAGTFYAHYEKKNQAAVAYTSVSISLTVFLGIIFYGTSSDVARFLDLPPLVQLVSDLRAILCRSRGTRAHEPDEVVSNDIGISHSSFSISAHQGEEFEMETRGQGENEHSFFRQPLDLIDDHVNVTQ